MTAYGRPPTSRTAVATDSSIGTRRVAEPDDPGAVAERLGERRRPGRARRPRPCGARRPRGRRVARIVEVEQAVMGERAEQVVVEADAGLDRRRRPTPSRSSGDVTSVSRVARVTVDRADRRDATISSDPSGGRHRGDPPRLDLAGRGDQPVVAGPVADREPQVMRRAGGPAPNVRGTRPRRRSAVGDAPRPARRVPKSDEEEVRDATARPCQPAARERRRRAGRARRRRGRRSPRMPRGSREGLGDDGDADRRHGSRRPVRARSGRSSRAGRSRTRPAARPGRRPCSRSGRRRGSGGGGAARAADASDELGVRLVEDDDRGRLGRRRRRRRRCRRAGVAIAPSGSARPVGLFGLHSQTRSASRGGRADGVEIQGVALVRPEARHDDGARAALLGDDAVHRVGRGRDDGAAAGRQERLADQVEDLVRAGADEELVRSRRRRRRGGRLDEPAVVRRRVLGQRARRSAPRGEDPRPTSSGGAGEVLRSKRRIVLDRRRRSAPRPPRRSPPSCSWRAGSGG